MKRYIHSDQGVHYTYPVFQEEVENMGLIQSMSRRGNYWDNAPMESFFGHMKDVILSERTEHYKIFGMQLKIILNFTTIVAIRKN